MRESRYASRLRVLGFERQHMRPPVPNATGEAKPVFYRSTRRGKPSTHAIDELDALWIAPRHIDLATLGFEDCAATFPRAFRAIELEKPH